MKQQILIIHGADTFPTYEKYLEYLKNKEIDIETTNFQDWKATLENVLGGEYKVIAPRMPNKQNAQYLEWKIWFEKFLSLLREDLILIGHSMGGVFLAKYLSEDKINKKIRGLFLVAPPYKNEVPYAIGTFMPSKSLKKVAQQVGKIFLYYSEDDPVVPFSELKEYERELPQAQTRIFRDRGHFRQESFPEIVEDIKNL